MLLPAYMLSPGEFSEPPEWGLDSDKKNILSCSYLDLFVRPSLLND